MSSPVLQVDEVLQVELSGVLSEIDGVHVLEGRGERGVASQRCVQGHYESLNSTRRRRRETREDKKSKEVKGSRSR